MNDRYGAVRARAQALLAEYEHHPRRSATLADGPDSVFTKLEDIADVCFQLAVVEDDELPQGAIGLLDLALDTISFRPGLTPGRRAFTVAHELGHRALEHPEQVQIDTEEDLDESPDFVSLTVQQGVYRSYNTKSAYELEANVFAAELLAPSAEVRSYVLQERNWTVDGVAKKFGISRETALNQISAALREPARSSSHVSTTVLKQDDDHEAAIQTPGSALVLAGPGAGKTRVLVRRFERLVTELEVPARRILALTFSNKAAGEMRDRLTKALPQYGHELTILTFHSFALELVRLNWEKLRFKSEPRLLTPAELIAFLKTRLATMPLGVFENLPSPTRNLGLLMDAVSRAKDELVEPAQFIKLAKANLEEAQDDDARATAQKALDAGFFYEAYDGLLVTESMLDYGSLIELAVKLLKATENGIASAYDHILVDEFQDINFASGQLVKGLSMAGAKVWAVGDAKQSIYKFRGASPANMARFVTDFPGASIIPLKTNYRSVDDVVQTGKAVVIPPRHDAEALPNVELTSDRGRRLDGPGVKLCNCSHLQAELNAITSEAKEMRARYGASEVAILTRTRADADRIATQLEHAGMPTTWSGELQSSPIFKDVFAVALLASSDLRGIVRLAETDEYAIPEKDLMLLLDWAGEHGPSALSLLYSACDGSIGNLSADTKAILCRLKEAVNAMTYQPSAFHGIATYLFEHSQLCRKLLIQDSPRSRRDLMTIQQICALARSFRNTKGISGRDRINEFVEFVEACAESGKLETVVPDLADEDCVCVMTAHASKGLEWSAVFVPFLADRKFPNKARHEEIPIPLGLIRDSDPADKESEEACLFFVAATRAKDYLWLSVSDRYSKAVKQSPFFTQIKDALRGTGLSDEVRFEQEAAEPEVAGQARGVGFKFGDVVPLGSIIAFQRCPKRFEYTHILGLSSGDKGYARFRRSLTAAQRWISEQARGGAVPNLQASLLKLDELWTASGPVGHWYEERLKSQAVLALRNFHARVRDGAVLHVDEKFELGAEHRKIGLTLDEVEEAPSAVIRRVHFGPPYKSHLGKDPKEHTPALLLAAVEKRLPGRNAAVKISYPLIGHEPDTLATQNIAGRRLKKVACLADEAEAGPYPPKWSDFSCPKCPYALICPAGSEETEDEE